MIRYLNPCNLKFLFPRVLNIMRFRSRTIQSDNDNVFFWLKFINWCISIIGIETCCIFFLWLIVYACVYYFRYMVDICVKIAIECISFITIIITTTTTTRSPGSHSIYAVQLDPSWAWMSACHCLTAES